ncbi:lysine decarboxylase [Legionella sainthelensi]|uniref:Cytokinin riboside 5'-monophosphate phosphoribohydrolase n=1 Tax=Legionella sainthelensi TaxID=28087 RepID=A0A0W0YSR6_9GAMM|nr:TIGR00730 family Rossman fold protein [Legionella sainthelensi]KTD59743.1 lysine decarboxylase [Legionella sainthelensi]VEH31699.1 lysine decarboxylase [Legionella sainthelensi]
MNNTEVIVSPTIGVYLGSSMGNNPSFKDAVASLGAGIAKQGYTVVYGGGGTGLMGLLAQTVKSHGGAVIGVTTEYLAKIETPSEFLDELYVVSSMYERKRLIHEKSSQLIVMPGGIGTFDELFETWCAIKIGVIKKPFGLINIEGYFNSMLQFVDSCTRYDLLNEQDIKIPTVYNEVSSYLNYLREEQGGNFFEVNSNLNPSNIKNKDKHRIEIHELG